MWILPITWMCITLLTGCKSKTSRPLNDFPELAEPKPPKNATSTAATSTPALESATITYTKIESIQGNVSIPVLVFSSKSSNTYVEYQACTADDQADCIKGEAISERTPLIDLPKEKVIFTAKPCFLKKKPNETPICGKEIKFQTEYLNPEDKDSKLEELLMLQSQTEKKLREDAKELYLLVQSITQSLNECEDPKKDYHISSVEISMIKLLSAYSQAQILDILLTNAANSVFSQLAIQIRQRIQEEKAREIRDSYSSKIAHDTMILLQVIGLIASIAAFYQGISNVVDWNQFIARQRTIIYKDKSGKFHKIRVTKHKKSRILTLVNPPKELEGLEFIEDPLKRQLYIKKDTLQGRDFNLISAENTKILPVEIPEGFDYTYDGNLKNRASGDEVLIARNKKGDFELNSKSLIRPVDVEGAYVPAKSKDLNIRLKTERDSYYRSVNKTRHADDPYKFGPTARKFAIFASFAGILASIGYIAQDVAKRSVHDDDDPNNDGDLDSSRSFGLAASCTPLYESLNKYRSAWNKAFNHHLKLLDIKQAIALHL